MHAVEACRTAALGGHVEQCDRCAYRRIAYNSCRDRHCPKCQSLAKAKWLESQQRNLLPCEYFHVVFTIPECIAALAFYNQTVVYNILFRAAAQTLQTIARDPRHLGAQIGFLTVLHTWGQNLLFHPHLHCVVTGGGLSPDGHHWIGCRPGFFLPVRVLSRLFRRLFLAELEKAFRRGKLHFFSKVQTLSEPTSFSDLLKQARKAEWVVYAKHPFGGPQQVLDYLGRYTHRVAISNNRLLAIENANVSFRWRDYRCRNKPKVMTLQADEFIRRFLLHVLPPGFVRIRYYGLLGNRYRSANLALCRDLLGVPAVLGELQIQANDFRVQYELLTGNSLVRCPVCCRGKMMIVERLLPTRASPVRITERSVLLATQSA